MLMQSYLAGAFDVIAELWPHLSVITYRLNPGKHKFLTKVFLYTCVIQVASTIIQTGLILWVFISPWDKWTIGMKISTPILHVLFSAAQLYGAWFTYRLYKKQARLAASAVSDSGSGSHTVDEGTVDQFPKEAETAIKEA
jgi:hypothetical protein